jgi:hypothetical protein
MAMDVRDWLRSLGLERYEAAFRENAVDAEVLPTLTADDLKEMGVVPGATHEISLAKLGLNGGDSSSIKKLYK